MKNFFKYIIVLFCCLASQQVSAAGTIDGTVTDANTGNPIAGALIEVNKGNQVRYSTTTAGDGTYSISGISKSNYIVVTTASGFQTQSVGVSVQNNQTSTVNSALEPFGGTINGTVTDVSSVPIAGATVEIFQGQTLIASTNTDGSGFYSVPDLAPSNYTVRASATGFSGQEKGATVQSSVTTTVDFALAINPGTISGTVTDSLSQPIVGALIEVRNGDTVVGFADTDAGGAYVVPGLAPGNYTVVVSADTFQAQSVGATVIASTVTTVDFTLAGSPGSISGTVISAATGLPIPGAAVVVDQNKIIVASGLTDSNGHYSMTSLAPGNYNVVVDATDFALGAVGATVNANADTVVNFVLSSIQGIIAGIVTDALTTQSLAGVSIEVFSGQILVASTLTDPNGGYSLSVPLGYFTVVANTNNHQTQAIGALVRISTIELVSFALVPDPGTITGTITNAVTTAPIPGAPVRIFQGLTQIGSALTGVNGSYTIGNLAPGSYIVAVSATDFQARTVGATVTANTITTVDVALTPSPGAIAGTVTNASTGAGIPSAAISVFQNSIFVTSALTDNNGNYSIPGLAPNNYTVTANATDFIIATLGAAVTANTTTQVDFALIAPPGEITGTVTDAITTNPIAGATVAVFNGQTLIASVLTDPQGNYQITDLPPDSHTIAAKAPNYQLQVTGALVPPNDTTVVDFALVSPPGAIAGTITDANTTNPIAGATVEVFDGTTLIGSTNTAVDGTYIITSIAPGNYIVDVGATDYQSRTVGASVITSSTTTVDVALTPDPGAIAGTVTNAANGAGIPSTTISVFQNSIFITSAITDNNGNYSITGLAPNNYVVSAHATNFIIDVIGATVTAGDTTQADFALSPSPGEIVGTVTDAITTNPIAGATVGVFDGPVLIASTLTDPQGKYQITDLAPGDYTVAVKASSYQIQTSSEVVASNATTTVDFALELQPGTIAGTVTDSTTTDPIAGATITVYDGTILVGSTNTGVDGTYAIADLAPGDYFVVATAQGYQTAFSTETVVSNLTTTADFALDLLPGAIVGNITDACGNGPLGGVLVLVTDGEVIVGFDVSDNQGNYVVPNLAPGTYVVVAAKRNFLRSSVKTAIVVESESTTVNFVLTPSALPPASISGKTICNKYLTQTDYAHAISWAASPGECITGYVISRNGQQIAVVSPRTLKYVDCKYKCKRATYSVATINSFGMTSAPLTIVLN